MEAEELEELNPAIKGKRLQVVDEVFIADVDCLRSAVLFQKSCSITDSCTKAART